MVFPMKPNTNPDGPSCRVAYTVAEVSAMFGKHRTWGHRQVKKGRIHAIDGFGVTLISAQELKRILNEADDS